MTDRVNGGVSAGEFLTGNMDFFTVLTLVPTYQTNVVTPVVDLPGYQVLANTGVWTNVAVADVTGTVQTYSSLSTYLDAFYKQLNLNNLIGTFSARANPVAISVNTFTGNIPGTATPLNANTSTLWAAYNLYNNVSPTPTQVFGSSYTTGAVYYSVHIATEKSLAWVNYPYGNFDYPTDGQKIIGVAGSTTADNSNLNGYSLLSNNTAAAGGGLDTLVAYDTNGSQVIGGTQGSNASNFYYLKNTVQPYVATWSTSSATLCNTLACDGFVLNTSTSV